MNIAQLFQGFSCKKVIGNESIEITSICIDSRKSREGCLFLAVNGSQNDGHKYIPNAIAAGATAVVCERLPENTDKDITYIVVENTEQMCGDIATRFYGNPSSKLKLVGVTGTNGKTTTATVLYQLFRKLGYHVGLLSTVVNYVDDTPIPTEHTTPDPITLNELLSKMVEAGCEYVFMEVSSHAIVQNRIGGLHFAGGIFTNITRDHLDYHKTFENYLKAKKAFFDHLTPDAFALTNADDKNGMVMVQNTAARISTYAIGTAADFKAKIIECHFEGMYLDFNGEELGVQFIGRFNVSNLLAVFGTAVLLGEDPHEVRVALSVMHPVSGRFESLRSKSGITAIVDYAHTPDALENVLKAIHGVQEGKGKVITVCGAGGNRDKGKRPLMAQEAVRQSDRVIITSDNPRFEEPQDIINDMLAGLNEEQMGKVLAIVDRKEAIRTACLMAGRNDVVLVAGKGHEDYQEVKGVKHHFDDKEVIRDIFETL